MNKDYNLLRLLMVLYETRQTVAAARKLNISQPTVSLMLKKLREQFSDELFVRNKNMLEPTEKCTDIVDRIPALIDQIEQLYATNEPWGIEQMKGEITFLFPATLMAPIAAPLVAKLTVVAPLLTVTCHPWEPNSLRNLEQTRNYWGVGYLPLATNKNVVEMSLPDDKFMLVTRKGHPLTAPVVEELLKFPLCVSVIPGYIEASKVEMLIKKHKLEKNVSVRSSDSSMMLELIHLSDTIGVMSIKNTPLITDRFDTYPLPKEFYQETFRRECALFCHLRDRNTPFTNWIFQELTTMMRVDDESSAR
ncbi:LysR family transcriptional regulator [Vibrio kyushuensis]|uniref:LysR family transcriptional regulator n=1 Tax=Vibrio TaxID=662 RepID=UPI003D152AE5